MSSIAHLLPLVGRSGRLCVAVNSRHGWRIPVRVVDVRIRYGIADLLVCQPGVERPSERDGSALWVERARVDFDSVEGA